MCSCHCKDSLSSRNGHIDPHFVFRLVRHGNALANVQRQAPYAVLEFVATLLVGKLSNAWHWRGFSGRFVKRLDLSHCWQFNKLSACRFNSFLDLVKYDAGAVTMRQERSRNITSLRIS